MTLTARDTQSVWRLSNELLRVDTLNGLVGVLFDEGRRLFPFDSAVLFPLENAPCRPNDAGHLGRGMNAGPLAHDYAQRFHRLDPLRVVEKPSNHNRALRTHDVISQRKYRASEIWHEFYRPIGIDKVMGMCVVNGDTPVCGLGLHREKSARSFSAVEQARLTLLSPAIANAFGRLRLRDAAGQLSLDAYSGLGDKTAVWLLAPSLRIHDRNAQAKKVSQVWQEVRCGHMKDPFPKAVQELIARLRGGWSSALRMPGASAGSGSVSCLLGDQWYLFTVTLVGMGPDGAGPESIVVTALRRSRLIDLSQSVRGLGLSAREEEITRLVMRGQSNKEIANTLEIVEQTVKDHLRSIYTKAGVNSRTRLIALLLDSL